MQTVFIFDDEYPFVEKISNLLDENALNVIYAANYDDSMKFLDKWMRTQSFPDLYIFDYNVSGNNYENNYTGLDIAEKMLAQREVPSILITGLNYNDEIRRKAKELNIDAKYKLSKDLLSTAEGRNDFMDMVFEALYDDYPQANIEKLHNELTTIGIKQGLEDDYFFFEYESLLYLEAQGNACEIFFTDRKSYTFGTNMGEVGKKIASMYATFVPAGRSYFVNLNNITAMKNGTVSFKSVIEQKASITLGTPAYNRLKDRLKPRIVKTR